MEFLETVLLIKAVKWLLRWLSSNEKNRKLKEQTFIDDVVDAVFKALDGKYGD